MAKFTGFACDSCGEVGLTTTRTVKIIRFEGLQANGQYKQDLCPNCVVIPEGITLSPLPTRKRRSSPSA